MDLLGAVLLVVFVGLLAVVTYPLSRALGFADSIPYLSRRLGLSRWHGYGLLVLWSTIVVADAALTPPWLELASVDTDWYGVVLATLFLGLVVVASTLANVGMVRSHRAGETVGGTVRATDGRLTAPDGTDCVAYEAVHQRWLSAWYTRHPSWVIEDVDRESCGFSVDGEARRLRLAPEAVSVSFPGRPSRSPSGEEDGERRTLVSALRADDPVLAVPDDDGWRLYPGAPAAVARQRRSLVTLGGVTGALLTLASVVGLVVLG